MVLLSGGSRGIGAAAAAALLDAGACVCLTYRQDAAGAAHREQAAAAAGAGDRLTTVRADVRDAAAAKEAVRHTLERFGTLDALVNNAGVLVQGHLQFATTADYDLVMDTNVRGPYLLMRAAIPRLPKGGRIVNIASVVGIDPIPDASLYCASKAALIALTRSVAQEVAPDILVNAIAPGPIRTAMTARGYGDDLLTSDAIAQGTWQRRWAGPQEVAPAVVYLCSPASGYVTGAVLRVDGGRT